MPTELASDVDLGHRHGERKSGRTELPTAQSVEEGAGGGRVGGRRAGGRGVKVSKYSK